MIVIIWDGYDDSDQSSLWCQPFKPIDSFLLIGSSSQSDVLLSLLCLCWASRNQTLSSHSDSAVDLIRLGGGRLRFLVAKSDPDVSEKISASSCWPLPCLGWRCRHRCAKLSRIPPFIAYMIHIRSGNPGILKLRRRTPIVYSRQPDV